MDKIYTNIILDRKVGIASKQLKGLKNMEELLLTNLTKEIEGKCIHEGYVKPNSIKIYERSIGRIIDGHFDGNIFYNVRFSVNLCNPPEGSIISCTVHSINKMGILAGIGIIGNSPLLILLARQHHIDNDLFNQINEGDPISVVIVGKKYELGDKQINIIAELKTKEKKVKIIRKKKKKQSKEGGSLFNVQNYQEIYNFIDSNIRNKKPIDNGLQSVITDLRKNVEIFKWDKMDVSEKSEIINKYLKNNNLDIFSEDFQNEEMNEELKDEIEENNSDEDLLEL
jgi:DNA-directed RNA polymerase subunit E'/Rpb7